MTLYYVLSRVWIGQTTCSSYFKGALTPKFNWPPAVMGPLLCFESILNQYYCNSSRGLETAAPLLCNVKGSIKVAMVCLSTLSDKLLMKANREWNRQALGSFKTPKCCRTNSLSWGTGQQVVVKVGLGGFWSQASSDSKEPIRKIYQFGVSTPLLTAQPAGHVQL